MVAVTSDALVAHRIQVVVFFALFAVGSVRIVGAVLAVTTVTCLAPQGLIKVALVGATITVASCRDGREMGDWLVGPDRGCKCERVRYIATVFPSRHGYRSHWNGLTSSSCALS